MLKSILSLIAGAVLLILGLMFSLAIFAAVAIVTLSVWGYFWWQTRRLRQVQWERAENPAPADGQIIEGESAIVEEVQPNARIATSALSIDSAGDTRSS